MQLRCGACFYLAGSIVFVVRSQRTLEVAGQLDGGGIVHNSPDRLQTLAVDGIHHVGVCAVDRQRQHMVGHLRSLARQCEKQTAKGQKPKADMSFQCSHS